MLASIRNLRLVESDLLLLHEAHDLDRLTRLRETISAEGVQRHPVIAVAHGERYLVLDGAHRARALSELGHRFTLVQEVEPPELSEAWGHLLDREPAEIRSVLGSLESLVITEKEPEGGALAAVEFGDGERTFIRVGEGGLAAEVRALWELQAVYRPGRRVRRVGPGEAADPVRGSRVVIRYRGFSVGELVEVVASGSVLPPGITRFRLKERVLGVSFPLERMADGDPLERNAELERFVARLWEENRVRSYDEPVVLFE